MMCNIVPQTTKWWRNCKGGLTHTEVARILVAIPSVEAYSAVWKPSLVVPAEHYVEQLWAALDQTLHHSKCGIWSDTPVFLT